MKYIRYIIFTFFIFENQKNQHKFLLMSRKKNKNSLSTFVNTILTIFGENPFKPMNYKQIAKIMSVRDAAGKDVIYQILVTLHKEGKLIEDKPYRYLLHPD